MKQRRTRWRAMRHRGKRTEQAHNPERKARKCLMCRKDFISEWAGERICKNCKSKRAWKDALGP